MEIRWRWSSLVILIILSQTTQTHNVENKWNLTNKKQKSEKENKNYMNLSPLNLNIKNQQQKSGSESLESSEKYNYEDIFESANEHLHRVKLEDESSSKSESDNSQNDKSNEPHSRQKRLIWVTDDGRLALPPGTTLSISPTLALPFVRYPPEGFFSNLTISLPLTIDFDKLGLTDNQNPLGVLPPVFARSMGRAAGSLLANYISKYLKIRKKRDIPTSIPQREESSFKILATKINGNDEDEDKNEDATVPVLPDKHKHAFHGGERALLYMVVEDFLATFGLDGKACLLRAICEIHSKQVHNLGLVGEMLKLFFTASKSPFSEFIPEYVSAEQMGQGKEGPGECFPYYKNCPKSLFRNEKNKYSDIKSEFDDNEKNIDNTINEIDSGHISM